MSDPKDKAPKAPDETVPESDEKRSGRVGFDERGNSVWEWQLETGVYSRDVSTQRLKKLELNELSIAETARNKRPTGLGGEKAPGGGFNPYDSAPRSSGGNPYDSAPRSTGGNPYDNARSLGDKFRDRPKPDKPRTPDDMRKLSEEIRKRKQMKEE